MGVVIVCNLVAAHMRAGALAFVRQAETILVACLFTVQVCG